MIYLGYFVKRAGYRIINMQNRLLIIILILLIAIPGISQDTFPEKSEIKKAKTASIIGVGDIMLGTDYPSRAFLPRNNDCNYLLNDVYEILNSADVTFGNLEGCFLDNGEVFKKCRDTTKCYVFKMPEKYAKSLSKAGFDILSLANNHAGDFGPKGLDKTKELLDSLDIKYAGIHSIPYSIFTKNGLKYGFCAFSPNYGNSSINNLEVSTNIIKQLDKLCDIIIVSFHGGAEGQEHEHVTRKQETYYGENRGNVYKFAHNAVDAGADIIFGHGPHVTRAIDLYKERFIIYSLGNFITYARFNISGVYGVSPIIKLTVDNKGKFLEGEIVSTFQTYEKGIQIDSLKRVIKKVQELTKADFPEINLDITNNGIIKYKNAL